MSKIYRSALLCLVLVPPFAGAAGDDEKKPAHPAPAAPVEPKDLEAAIGRGVAFLLKDQNADGSWGSAERTKDLNIYAPVPGAHHAFRAAVSSLCVSALVEVDDGSPAMSKAIDRGAAYLFAELPKVRRAEPMAIYNVWAHAYGIQALAHLYARKSADEEQRRKIKDLIQGQYDLLGRYESAEGGWGYYDTGAQTQRPNSSSTSFTNAAVLEAFHEAKMIGAPPPKKLLKRGVEMTRFQRLPNFSYLYGTYLQFSPTHPIHRSPGSLGRTQACNLALRLWGDKKVTDDVVKTWLDRLIVRNGWLDNGRKRPIPHEAPFGVAGYFYYFGHYYAGLCIGLLKPADRPFYQDHLARIIMAVQEKDGSWWDYPLYNYHQQYGTAFALMTLKACRREQPSKADSKPASSGQAPESR